MVKKVSPIANYAGETLIITSLDITQAHVTGVIDKKDIDFLDGIIK